MSNNNKPEFGEKLEEEVYKTIKSSVKDTYHKSMIFLIIFVLFVINLFALSLSLHCNRHSPLVVRIASALFAFMFGFFYILVNYYYYRGSNKNQPYACTVCSKTPFAFFKDFNLIRGTIKNFKDTAIAFKG